MPRHLSTEVDEKQRQAIELRAAGQTFTEIGATLGVTKQRAEQLVKKKREGRPAKAPPLCPHCGKNIAEGVNPWLAARKAKGWSTREAAKAAGVSASLVSRVENGREVEFAAGFALARAYGVSAESLIP